VIAAYTWRAIASHFIKLQGARWREDDPARKHGDCITVYKIRAPQVVRRNPVRNLVHGP
jgi:hypothetical protein